MKHLTKERQLQKSLVEYNTLSDNAWTTWQYVNSYDDWALKKEALGQRVAKQKHKLQSRYTSNGHSCFHPRADSEGTMLYQKCWNGMPISWGTQSSLTRSARWPTTSHSTCFPHSQKISVQGRKGHRLMWPVIVMKPRSWNSWYWHAFPLPILPLILITLKTGITTGRQALVILLWHDDSGVIQYAIAVVLCVSYLTVLYSVWLNQICNGSSMMDLNQYKISLS